MQSLKKELSERNQCDINSLCKFYNIPVYLSKNDTYWLIAINIANQADGNELLTIQKGQMLKSMYKPQTTSIGIGNIAQKYNLNDRSCEWPTSNSGFDQTVKNCNINIIPVTDITVDNKTYKIVRIPRGTKIYHGTKNLQLKPENKNWDKTNLQMVWFATTKEHTMPLGPLKILEFTVKQDLVLIFERNITVNLGYASGKMFMVPLLLLTETIGKKTDYDINIDGYIGCNECEIGLFKSSFDKLEYPPVEHKPLFID